MDYSSIFMCLMGASTAFLGLICVGVWRLAGSRTVEQPAASVPTPAAAAFPAAQPAAAASLPQEMIAAISAAIAEELGTDITGIRITSIKRI